MATTMPPTGLAISRSNDTISFSWKFGQTYDKQEYKYTFDGTYPKAAGTPATYNGYVALNNGTTKSEAVNIPTTALYPTGTQTKKCKTFTVQVRGHANSTNKWSKWVSQSYKFLIPNDAIVTREGMTVTPNVDTTYTAGKGDPYLSDIQYEMLLSSVVEQKNVKWSDTGKGTKPGSYTTGTLSNNEKKTLVSDTGWITWFRCRPRGITGDAKNYTYASAKNVTPIAPTAVKASMAGLNVTVNWTPHNTEQNPTDTFEIYYTIATPAAGGSCPSGATWTKGLGGINKKANTATFAAPQRPGTDKCMWVKVSAVYSPYTAESDVVFCAAGALAPPTVNSCVIDSGTKSAVLTWTDNSTIPDSKTAIVSSDGSILGTFAHGVTTGTVTYKGKGDIQFGVYVFQGTSATKYNMKSQTIYFTAVDKPLPPTSVSVSPTAQKGTVSLSWVNAWTDAEGTEISYADHEDAWESTAEPTKYQIEERKTAWNVAGLELGKTWYFKLRSIGIDEDNEKGYSPYSAMVSVDLASAPEKPVLFASDSVIDKNDTLTLSWAYTSTDNTDQENAFIYDQEVGRTDTFKGNGNTKTFPLSTTPTSIDSVTVDGTATSAYTRSGANITFTTAPAAEAAIVVQYTFTGAKTQIQLIESNALTWSGVPEWRYGSAHNLSVVCKSKSGYISPESDPVQVLVAPAPVINSLDSAISAGIVGGILQSLPLTLTITGAGTGGTTGITIERVGDYHMERPDESQMDGFDGETIYSTSYQGERTITIKQEDLVGSLDDGAKYRIRAKVTDEIGQSSEAEYPFTVSWSHQATAPGATVSLEGLTALISPTASSASVTAGDLVDIYRLSIDKPELIIKGGTYGKTYLDPYPSHSGGYRCVCRTTNGDYIGADNKAAWFDVAHNLKFSGLIIDFDGNQIQLPYNVSLQNEWAKDFKETKYLNGHVQGDWNAGTSRSTAIDTLVSTSNKDTIEMMRDLATYEGICHVRTYDGSSFAADVQISESRGSNEHSVTFNMRITRVDSEGFDGVQIN